MSGRRLVGLLSVLAAAVAASLCVVAGIRHLQRARCDIFAAVKDNDAERIQDCVERGAKADSRDKLGVTPLHLAAWYGYEQCAEVLIARDAEVGATDTRGNTPLHYAVRRSRAQVVKVLLEAGADPDAQNSAGQSPLHLAAGHLCGGVAETLIKSGASVGIRDARGRTALFAAVAVGDKDMVTYLARCGASLNVVDTQGNTLVGIAGTNRTMRALLSSLGKGRDRDLKSMDAGGSGSAPRSMMQKRRQGG